MPWHYNVVRDELAVSYDGVADRPVSKALAARGYTIELDSTGEPVRILIRHVSRLVGIDTLGRLDDLPEPGETVHTLAEAADALGVQVHVIRKEILDGGMPARKGLNTWRIRGPVLELCREILGARRHISVEQKRD